MKPIGIIGSLLNKNRTWVSQDFTDCIAVLGQEIPLTVHRFPSGNEYGTWNIPDEWNVIKAELTDGMDVLASYADHPLFLAPFSCSFTGWVARDELLAHTRTVPRAPDTFSYEYSIASDFRRRSKEWIITLPQNLADKLDRPEYYVDIQVETKPGHMLVGESTIKGRENYTFAILTHLCHPGQANDGLGGVAVGIEVMKRLTLEIPEPNYSYQLLVMPETIGSSVYLAANEDRIDSYLGSIFIEIPGIRSPLSLKNTRRGNTYLDKVLRHIAKKRGIEFTECGFREQWGNDELVFDSPGVGIPSASIQRFPFHWYHTSGDNMEETSESRLDEIVEILLATIRLIESDFIPVPRQRVPVYLTRYDLYSDAIFESSDHRLNAAVLDSFWN